MARWQAEPVKHSGPTVRWANLETMMNPLHASHRAAKALALAGLLAAQPVQADLVLRGSDYYQTVQPTALAITGLLNPLAGLAVGPGTTDTIVRRMGDCSLSLSSAGSSCNVAIEMVAMSLVSIANPMMRVRESPTLTSSGTMTMVSDGSGNGGTLNSFFDVFTELSLDNGQTWVPALLPIQMLSVNQDWSTQPPLLMFVDGGVNDPNANRHTDKATAACPVFGLGQCVDFYRVGPGSISGTGGTREDSAFDGSLHSFTGAQLPEPGSLALALGALAALAALAGGSGRQRRCAGRASAMPA